jgi:hypothetical protein
MSGHDAASMLRDAQRQVENLFGASDSGESGSIPRSWRETRKVWNDEVARAIEDSDYGPLVSEAKQLARTLASLASRIESI